MSATKTVVEQLWLPFILQTKNLSNLVRRFATHQKENLPEKIVIDCKFLL